MPNGGLSITVGPIPLNSMSSDPSNRSKTQPRSGRTGDRIDRAIDGFGLLVMAFGVVALLITAILLFRSSPRVATFCFIASGFGALLLPWNSFRLWILSDTSKRAHHVAESRDESNSGVGVILLKIMYFGVVIWATFLTGTGDETNIKETDRAVKTVNNRVEDLSSNDVRQILSKELDELTQDDKSVLVLAGIKPGSEHWKKLHDEVIALDAQ